MTYNDNENLVEELILLFWAQNAEDRALIHEAAEDAPGSMARIHLLCQLLYTPEGGARLLDRRIGSDESVRELLAAGASGIARLEAILIESFYDQAPREIYDQGGEAACPVLTLLFLLHLLEARREEGFQWRNPLSDNCEPIEAGDARLAQAVLSAGQHLCERNLYDLIASALQDPAEVVRCTAARLAASLADIGPVLCALSQLPSDAVTFVRRAALESLSPFSSRTEVADCIAAFSHDPDPALRRLVVKLLLEDEEVYCDDWRLVHLAFDCEVEIAEIARTYFSPSDIRGYLRRLAQLAANGGTLHPSELEILAKPAYVDLAIRRRVFSQRFRRLDPFGDAHQLALTVTALEAFARDLDPSFWRDAATAVDAHTNSVVGQSLALLHAKAKTAA